MKIIEQYFEVIHAPDYAEVLRVLELSTRTAYKLEDKIKDGSAEKLLKNVLSREPTPHESVIEHMGFTLKFVTDRGVSHELVRHRLASFTQESTRYCNYGKGGEVTFVLPVFWSKNYTDPCMCSNEFLVWKGLCANSEKSYLELLEYGATPQEARSILPNSLKTELVMTANFREWRHVFKLRTHKTAHPQMRHLMRPVLIWAREKYPVVFEGVGFLED